MPKPKLEIWNAVTGNAPELMYQGKRAYFPHVVLPSSTKFGRDERMTVHSGSGPMAEADRRAKLIAAAPQMLAMLETIMKLHARTMNGIHFAKKFPADACRAVIAKAKE